MFTGIDASATFLSRPERSFARRKKKRKIIGKTFIDIFSTVEDQIGKVQFFCSGYTIP